VRNHFLPDIVTILRQGHTVMGASNTDGVGTSRDCRRISGYRSMTAAAVQTTSATVHHAVYRTVGDTSVNLCLSQPAACMTTTKRREENRICFYAAVKLKWHLRSTYCTIKAVDR